VYVYGVGLTMANGRAHNVGTLAITLLSGAAAYSLSGDVEFSGLVMGGGALTLLVNPDTDQEAISRNELKLIRNTLGLGFIWLALWHPYAVLFRHRGISHVPVIGTLTRIAYIGAVVGLCAYLVEFIGPYRLVVNLEEMTAAICGMFTGMAVSDALHWVMDGMPV